MKIDTDKILENIRHYYEKHYEAVKERKDASPMRKEKMLTMLTRQEVAAIGRLREFETFCDYYGEKL